MTKKLANEIEAYLKSKLQPEHGYVLIYGEVNTGHSGIISPYSGETVVKLLKHFGEVKEYIRDVPGHLFGDPSKN